MSKEKTQIEKIADSILAVSNILGVSIHEVSINIAGYSINNAGFLIRPIKKD